MTRIGLITLLAKQMPKPDRKCHMINRLFRFRVLRFTSYVTLMCTDAVPPNQLSIRKQQKLLDHVSNGFISLMIQILSI